MDIGATSGDYLTFAYQDIQAKNGSSAAELYVNVFGGVVDLCQGQFYVVSSAGAGVGTTALNGYKFYVAGSAYGTGGWSGSDARWKKNVQPVTNALDKVIRLQGVTYDWRRDEFPQKNFDDGTQLGFLDQDVEKVAPEAVRTDSEGYKAIAYEKLTAVLTEGVKEQQSEIESLKARNATLERQMVELRTLVNQLMPK